MEAQQPPSMSKVAMKYGLIDGVLAFLIFLVTAMTGTPSNWKTSAVSIVLLVVLMVLAHREFKKPREGIMTYGQGVGLGTLLAVFATVLVSVLRGHATDSPTPNYRTVPRAHLLFSRGPYTRTAKRGDGIRG